MQHLNTSSGSNRLQDQDAMDLLKIQQGNSMTQDQAGGVSPCKGPAGFDPDRIRGPVPRVVLCFKGAMLGTYDILPQRALRVGRSHGNEIPVNDQTVSRHHADLLRAPNGESVVRDKGSTNGTFVNGRQIHQAVLHDGDTVQVGHHRLFFVAPDPAATRRNPAPVVSLTRDRMVTAHDHEARARENPEPVQAEKSAAAMAWLEVINTNGKHERLDLTRRVTPLGNDDRRQAAVRQWSGGYMISPLWGDEFPRVNGEQVISGHRNLESGDTIEFCGQRYTFYNAAG